MKFIKNLHNRIQKYFITNIINFRNTDIVRFFIYKLANLYNSIYTVCSKAAYQSVDIVLCVFSPFWPSIKMKACNNVYTC